MNKNKLMMVVGGGGVENLTEIILLEQSLEKLGLRRSNVKEEEDVEQDHYHKLVWPQHFPQGRPHLAWLAAHREMT